MKYNIVALIKNKGLLYIVSKVIKKSIQLLKRPFLDIILSTSYSKTLLAKWHQPKERTFIDNILFNSVVQRWFEKEYWPEPDPDVRVKKQELLMGGLSGAEWAAEYDSTEFDPEEKIMMGRYTLQEGRPIFSWLEKSLMNAEETVVYQVGSSSGREIAYFAKRFPQHKFIGTDIFPDVIKYSASKYVLNNLEYHVVDAKNLGHFVKRTSNNKRSIIFSSSSLQYVQPEHIQKMFDEIFQLNNNVEVMVLEPAQEFPQSPYDLQKSTPRWNFSWNHNYKLLAEKSGFSIKNATVLQPYIPYEKWPSHYGTVTCTLHAIKKSDSL